MLVIFTISFLFFVPACFIIMGMYQVYIYTIKLVYEYGYNKNVSKEKSEYSNVDSYEDKADLSLLAIFPYIFIVLCIAALFREVFNERLVITLPMIAIVFGIWAVINYTVIYAIKQPYLKGIGKIWKFWMCKY